MAQPTRLRQWSGEVAPRRGPVAAVDAEKKEFFLVKNENVFFFFQVIQVNDVLCSSDLRRGGRLRGAGVARLAEVRRRRRSGILTSMAPLSRKHQVLIQALLARGPLFERDFHAIFDGAFGKNTANDQQLFNDTLWNINKELAFIAFYKGLLEAIIREAGNDGSITSIDALNVQLENQVTTVDGSQDNQSHLPIKNLSLSEKEKALDELIRDCWLSYTSTGKIGLGSRSFLDLRSWFYYNDIPSCVCRTG
uniref:Non-structural maintenance of chromosomes element 1 homolog n=1 Tax=Zea mays TaxID=4577 RepID=A0A804P0E8_MAIZE